MSANLHVGIQNTAKYVPSISFNNGLSGALGTIGQWVDMSNCDTYCNVYVTAGACSGPLIFQVQTAEGPYDIPLTGNAFSGNVFSGGAPMSGSFSDPTSGLAQLPTTFQSGGQLYVNSGLYTLPGALGASGQQVNGYAQGTLPFGVNTVQQGMGGEAQITSGSAPAFASGGVAFAGFQRNYQYARLILVSGATIPQYIQAGFISQSLTTGSGGGFTFSPQTGTVNV